MVVPYMKYFDPLYTKFDFSVECVTSISIDTHKYGYTDKGSSVILYRDNKNWRQYQIFVDAQWSGGVYATPTLSGSRSGKDIASTWGTLVFVGNDMYKNLANKIITLTKKLKNIIAEIPELKLLGNADVSIVAFTTKNPKINIYNIKNKMTEKGWYLSSLQNPNGLHFCVTAVHINVENFDDEFKSDLMGAIDYVKQNPSQVSSEAAMYHSNQSFGIKEFVPQLTREYWNILGKTSITSD